MKIGPKQADIVAKRRQKARLLIYVLAGAVTLIGGVLIGAEFHWQSAAVPQLEVTADSAGPLDTALNWPWAGFPTVTAVEREAIAREFDLDHMLITPHVPLWLTIPRSGPLRPGPRARRSLDAVFQDCRNIVRSPYDSLSDPELMDSDSAALERLIRDFGKVPRANQNWICLYNRAALYFQLENYRAAERELNQALRLLPKHRYQADAEVHAAAAHTYFARGHALAAGGTGEPQPQREQRRHETVRDFRLAVGQMINLWRVAGGDTAGSAHELGFFRIAPTGLPTAALASDLIASYFEDKSFHNCGRRPSGWPCGSKRFRGDCGYRDRVFCASYARAMEPFGAAFTEHMRAFFEQGESWNNEHILWALSNAVDFTAENVDIANPYLLYNFGCLLLNVGEFEPAARHFDLAENSIDDTVIDGDEDQIYQLRAAANILAGLSPTGNRGGIGPVTSVRAAFEKLYPPSNASVVRHK